MSSSVKQPLGDFEAMQSVDVDPHWIYHPYTHAFELGNVWVSVKWFPYLDEFLDWLQEHNCRWTEAYLGSNGYVSDFIICPDEKTATLFKLRWT